MTKIQTDKLAKQYRAAIRDIRSWLEPHTVSSKMHEWLSELDAALPWPKPERFPLNPQQEFELHAAYWRSLHAVLRDVSEDALTLLMERQRQQQYAKMF